jgi:hypothetical protein
MQESSKKNHSSTEEESSQIQKNQLPFKKKESDGRSYTYAQIQLENEAEQRLGPD